MFAHLIDIGLVLSSLPSPLFFYLIFIFIPPSPSFLQRLLELGDYHGSYAVSTGLNHSSCLKLINTVAVGFSSFFSHLLNFQRCFFAENWRKETRWIGENGAALLGQQLFAFSFFEITKPCYCPWKPTIHLYSKFMYALSFSFLYPFPSSFLPHFLSSLSLLFSSTQYPWALNSFFLLQLWGEGAGLWDLWIEKRLMDK